MSTVAELALARQARLVAINQTATNRALQVWQRMDPNNLTASWALNGDLITQQAVSAQLAAAAGSERFTNAVSAQYDFAAAPDVVVPEAIAGVDGAGRNLGGLLYGAVTTTKTATGAGMSLPDAFRSGAAYLASMMKTAVSDAARRSDNVSATGKGYTHYVRVVGGGACSRCAMLAGIRSSSTAFPRHPACQCTAAPVPGDRDTAKVPKGLHDSADSYFESLSAAEQDRVFTKAGAEAIRAGADPVQVVSARRGATGITTSRGIGRSTIPNSGRRLTRTVIGYGQDGAPVEVYTTSEGTTRYGTYAKAQRPFNSPTRARLMPESIMSIARTPAEARVLLRDAGYLTTPGLSPVQAAQQAATDRAMADRLFARAGFTL